MTYRLINVSMVKRDKNVGYFTKITLGILANTVHMLYSIVGGER